MRAVSDSPASFTSASARLQPRRASDMAMARPMPLAEPVITAVPFSSFIALVIIPRHHHVQTIDAISSGARLYSRLRSKSRRLARGHVEWRDILELRRLLRRAGRSRKCDWREGSAATWREEYVPRSGGHLRVEPACRFRRG